MSLRRRYVPRSTTSTSQSVLGLPAVRDQSERVRAGRRVGLRREGRLEIPREAAVTGEEQRRRGCLGLRGHRRHDHLPVLGNVGVDPRAVRHEHLALGGLVCPAHAGRLLDLHRAALDGLLAKHSSAVAMLERRREIPDRVVPLLDRSGELGRGRCRRGLGRQREHSGGGGGEQAGAQGCDQRCTDHSSTRPPRAMSSGRPARRRPRAAPAEGGRDRADGVLGLRRQVRGHPLGQAPLQNVDAEPGGRQSRRDLDAGDLGRVRVVEYRGRGLSRGPPLTGPWGPGARRRAVSACCDPMRTSGGRRRGRGGPPRLHRAAA